MNQMPSRYVIVAPVRNEEKYLSKTIVSIVAQTVLPTECIFVDDGSTDDTPNIINDAAKANKWIRYIKRPDRGKREVGPGVVEAFYDGYKQINSADYDFIIKMDGDLEIEPSYFETLFQKFFEDPYLGAASGKLFYRNENGEYVDERISDESVFGGVLCLKKQCFEQIGGFVKQVMWDGIVFHRLRMAGWRTRSFKDKELLILEQRQMGASQKSIYHGRLRWGRGQYFMGTHPVYILAIGAFRAFERPYLFGGLLIIIGYIQSWLKKAPRYDFPGFRKSLHAWQFERLRLGRRLENIPNNGL